MDDVEGDRSGGSGITVDFSKNSSRSNVVEKSGSVVEGWVGC